MAALEMTCLSVVGSLTPMDIAVEAGTGVASEFLSFFEAEFTAELTTPLLMMSVEPPVDGDAPRSIISFGIGMVLFRMETLVAGACFDAARALALALASVRRGCFRSFNFSFKFCVRPVWCLELITASFFLLVDAEEWAAAGWV